MVQAAEPWKRYNRATCNRILLRIATLGCSLRQRKMRSVVVVVTEVLDHQSFQMPFIDNDQMVEQVLATGADPALCDTVLPRALEVCPLGLDAKALHRADYFFIEVCTPIEDKISGSRIVRECLA